MMDMGPVLEHGGNGVLVGLEVHVSLPGGLPAGAVLHGDPHRLQWSKEVYNVLGIGLERQSSHVDKMQ